MTKSKLKPQREATVIVKCIVINHLDKTETIEDIEMSVSVYMRMASAK